MAMVPQNSDPFSQLDSELAPQKELTQKVVQTNPTDQDVWGNLDSQLGGQGTASTGLKSLPKAATGPGAAETAVDSYIRGTQNMVDGILDLGARVGELFGGGKELSTYRDELRKSNAIMNQVVDREAAQHPYAAAAGTGLGIVQQVLLGTAAKGGQVVNKGASLLSQVGTGAAEGMLWGASAYNPTIEGRLQNAAVGGVIGAAAPVALEGFKSAGKDIAGRLRGTSAEGSGMLSRIISPQAAAAQDINIVQSAKQDVQTMLDDFVPGGKSYITELQQKGYKGLENVNLGDDITEQLKTNPVISDQLAQMQSNTYSTKKGLPDSSFAKLDQVKQNIDDALYKDAFTTNTANLQKALDPETKAAYLSARNQIVDTLDQAGSSMGADYNGLRKIGEMKSLYTKLSDTLKQAPNQKNLAPSFDPNNVVQNKSVGKLYDVLAGTDLKQEYLLNAVQSAGGNVDNAKGVITLLNTLRNNPVDQILSAAKKAVDPSKDKMIGSVVNKLVSGRYNDAVLKLMASGPKLQDKLTIALQSGTLGETVAKLSPLLNNLSEGAARSAGIVAGSSPNKNLVDQAGYLPK